MNTLSEKIILALKNADNPNLGNVFVTESALSNVAESIRCLYIQTSSAVVSNTTNETSLLTSPVVLPVDFLTVGKQIMIRVFGIHSAAANPHIRIRIKLNSTVVLDTGSVSSGNSTNAYFSIDGVICCRSNGQTGTIMAQGVYNETGGGAGAFGMSNTDVITVDTTVSQSIVITAQWDAADSRNSLTATNVRITSEEVS